MTPTQVISITDKMALINDVASRLPSIENYRDVLFEMSQEGWENYRFFVYEQGDQIVIGGISPEDNFNIYGTRLSLMNQMFEHLKAVEPHPAQIFGPADSIKAIAAATHSSAFAYHFMTDSMIVKQSNDDERNDGSRSYEFVHARQTPSDLELIKNWYNSYNQEMHATWPSPTIDELKTKNYFYLKDENGEPVAFVANTLSSNKRFWIGRFYVLPRVRSEGIGAQLLRAIKQMAYAEHKQIALLVDTENTRAISFYERHGFKIISTNAMLR